VERVLSEVAAAADLLSMLIDHNKAALAVVERTLPRALLAALRRAPHAEPTVRHKRCVSCPAAAALTGR
jgi:hypothetical protein